MNTRGDELRRIYRHAIRTQRDEISDCPASVFYVPHQRGRIVKNLGMDKNGGRDRELMGRTLDRRQSMRYERPGVGHIEYWGRRKMRPWEEIIASIIELAKDGLMIDGAHHKQWYLEQILIEAGVDLKRFREELNEPDDNGFSYDWEEGIAP